MALDPFDTVTGDLFGTSDTGLAPNAETGAFELVGDRALIDLQRGDTANGAEDPQLNSTESIV